MRQAAESLGDNPLEQTFWIRHWEQREKQRKNTVSRHFTQPQRWDKVSKDHSLRWSTTGDDPLRDPVLVLLKEKGILREGIKILDLGCGTGRFAIPFAQMGAQVTAVDVSEGMLRYLKEKTPEEVSSRITPMQLDWHGADLDQLGFRSAFDLSFAHMTPAITGPESFLKFTSTSLQWCFLSGWSGPRRQNIAESVWKHLTGKDLDRNGGDIIYPFNLLYSMGYHPFIEFHHHRYETIADPEREADLLVDQFHEHVGGGKENIRPKILSFLLDSAQDGKIRKILTGWLGRMIWKVSE